MRSIWKGHIRFLLVAIPVRVYNAIETSEKIHLNQLHKEDYGPIGYDKRCKKCNQVVSNEEIIKGYQYSKDQYASSSPMTSPRSSQPPGHRHSRFVDASKSPRRCRLALLCRPGR